jgi:hypothetical protein
MDVFKRVDTEGAAPAEPQPLHACRGMLAEVVL